MPPASLDASEDPKKLHAMSSLANFMSQEELAAALEGKNRQQIAAEAEEAGIEMVLGKVLFGMVTAFDAARAGDRRVVLQYEIRASDRHHRFQLLIADGQCTITENGAEIPHL